MTRQTSAMISRVQDSMTSAIVVMLADLSRASSEHVRQTVRVGAGLHWPVGRGCCEANLRQLDHGVRLN